MSNRNDTIDTSIRRDEMFHARNMIILQDFITAKKILQELIRKRKDAAAPYFHLGYVEIALMAPKKALKNFTKAAILKPEITKYKQVLRWFTQIYDHDSDQSIKNQFDFMTAVVALLHDINATQFEHIKVYYTTPKQILSALNDAILLYHPINHHMEKAQQFILNRYSYVTLTQYKNYCLIHFSWVESGTPVDNPWFYHKYMYSGGNVSKFPYYRIRQRNCGHQMVVEKARSFYPTQPATHSKNGRFLTRGNYQKNTNMLINKQKRMFLICGFIFDPKYKLKDMIQIIDVFFNEHFWEWKVQDTNHMIQLQPSKGKCPFPVSLSYEDPPLGLFLSIDRRDMMRNDITFIKIYYELYDDETNEKIWKGTKKYRCFHVFRSASACERDDKILRRNTDIASAVLRLLTNNNIQLLIKVIHCEFLTNETYIHNYNQCVPTQMKSNVSFKWTIPNKHKLKSIQFSENFGNDIWCLYCASIKNPTNKKKKKFYIGVMLLTLPYPLDHLKIQLKIQLNIFNDDEKNTKVLTSKVWPGYESSLQIPFKSNVLFSSESNQSIDIFVNVKIIQMFKH